MTRFASDKGGDTYLDDRFLQGPLVKVFEQAFEVLSQNVHSEARFQTGDVRRTDRPEYPFKALREGLVNAFAHRDYAGFSGGVTVGIYPNRIEIWNSGHFPEGLQPADLKKNHPSLPTNPDIAHVLYLRGLMERIGRGGQLIVDACREHSLPAPKWVDRSSGVTLTIFGRVDEGIKRFTANPRQLELLAELQFGGQIRPGEYHRRYAADVILPDESVHGTPSLISQRASTRPTCQHTRYGIEQSYVPNRPHWEYHFAASHPASIKSDAANMNSRAFVRNGTNGSIVGKSMPSILP